MTPGKYRPIMVGQEKGRNHMKISLPGMEMRQQAKKGVEREMHGEQAILPPSTIIASPGKTIAIISLSGEGICGEEDFRWR